MDATSEYTSALPWALKSLWSLWWASQLLTWADLKISQPITSTCFHVMTSAVKDVLKWKPEPTIVLKDDDGQAHLSCCIYLSHKFLSLRLCNFLLSLYLFACCVLFSVWDTISTPFPFLFGNFLASSVWAKSFLSSENLLCPEVFLMTYCSVSHRIEWGE